MSEKFKSESSQKKEKSEGEEKMTKLEEKMTKLQEEAEAILQAAKERDDLPVSWTPEEDKRFINGYILAPDKVSYALEHLSEGYQTYKKEKDKEEKEK